MQAAEFKQAGLDKLQPAELAYLDQWLAAHAAELAAAVPASQATSARAAAAQPAATVERGSRQVGGSAVSSNDRVVTSNLVGQFVGWHAGTVMALANGQKWQVADGSLLVPTKPLDAPQVVVRRGLMGGWFLKVHGYNTSARVEPAN